MKISEIKALLPESETFVFDPDYQYLVLVDRNRIEAATIRDVANSMSCQTVFLAVDGPLDEVIRAFKLEEKGG